jgi:hypothetical protein
MHTPLGVRENEYAEAIPAEAPFEVSGDSQLQIVPGFLLPHGTALVSEIDFEKCRERFPWGNKLDIPIGD